MYNIQLLFIVLIVITLSYITGNLLQYIFKTNRPKDSFYELFSSTIIGLLFISSLFAIYKSHGNTIQWILIFMGVLTIYLNRKENQNQISRGSIIFFQNHKALIVIMLISVISFLFQGFLFYNEPFNNLPHGDFSFYTKVIDVLNDIGVESIAMDIAYVHREQTPIMPYHYTEMWIAAFMVKVFGLLTIEAIAVATHVILTSILFIGLITLVRTITKNRLMQIIMPLFLFSSGISIYPILPQAESFLFAMGYNPKVLIVSIFFVWFGILTIQKNKYNYVALLILPIVNISLAPAILSTTVSYWGTQFIKKKESWEKVKHPIILSFVVAILTATFYFINAGTETTGIFNLEDIINGIKSDFLKPFKIIAGTIAIVISLYFLYFFFPFSLFIKSKQRFIAELINYKQLYNIFTITFIYGLLYWAISHTILDSIQFFYMPVLLFLNLLIITTIIICFQIIEHEWKKFKLVFLLAIILLLAANFYQLPKTPFYNYRQTNKIYSSKYLSEIKSFIDTNKHLNKAGVYINSPNEQSGFWGKVPMHGPEYFMHLMTNNITTISLNTLYTPDDYDSEIDRIRMKGILSSYYFTRFAENYTETKNIQEIQLEYIKQHKPDFLIASKKAVIPKGLYPFINKKIIDKKTGQQFFILHYQYP